MSIILGNKMQNLKESELEFAAASKELQTKLNKKYLKVENNVNSIKCYEKNGNFKSIRVIADHERINPKFPTTNRQYQLEGGHRELARKIASKDSNAWKVEIKCYSDGQHYEIAPMNNGTIWLRKDFEKEMENLFL